MFFVSKESFYQFYLYKCAQILEKSRYGKICKNVEEIEKNVEKCRDDGAIIEGSGEMWKQ